MTRRSRSPPLKNNQPLLATPGLARAEIDNLTVVASRSRHSFRVSIATDHGVMDSSNGGGVCCCCCDEGSSAKRVTTALRISTSTSVMLLDDDGALLCRARLGRDADPRGDGRRRFKLQVVLVPSTEDVCTRPVDAHRVQERMHLRRDLVFPVLAEGVRYRLLGHDPGPEGCSQ